MAMQMVLESETEVKAGFIREVSKPVHVIPVTGIQGIVQAYHPMHMTALKLTPQVQP